MKAIFSDHEDQTNPLNGQRVTTKEAIEVIRSHRSRAPFVCSLETDCGSLLVGVSKALGFVQFTRVNGLPPYFIGTTDSTGTESAEEFFEFLSGGTPSPVPRRYCLPWPLVEEVVEYFMDHGTLPSGLLWEEI